MIWVLIATALGIGATLIRLMLRAVSGRGGEVDGDAAKAAGRIIAQAAAFRGDRSSAQAWDGVERLKGLEGNDGGGF
jgi:hypothetical protein